MTFLGRTTSNHHIVPHTLAYNHTIFRDKKHSILNCERNICSKFNYSGLKLRPHKAHMNNNTDNSNGHRLQNRYQSCLVKKVGTRLSFLFMAPTIWQHKGNPIPPYVFLHTNAILKSLHMTNTFTFILRIIKSVVITFHIESYSR